MSAAPSSRNRLIGALHAAAKKQGMDEDIRRALMVRVTGKSSAKDMSVAELGRVLDAMNNGAGGRNAGAYAWQRKVKALWVSAHQLGLTHSSDDKALDKFVERQSGVSALRFLPADKASRVIEALKDWMARPVDQGGGGVEWSKRRDDRRCVALAIWAQLAADRVVIKDWLALDAYARKVLDIPQHRDLTGAEWGQVLPVLARKLAKHKEAKNGAS